MGCVCTSESKNETIKSDILERLKRAQITKAYNFDKLGLRSLKCLDLVALERDINVFSARENNLNNLPRNFFEKINKIIKLDLESNSFIIMEDFIFDKVTMTTINFAHNSIDHIPKSISKLTNLKELYLSNNSIATIGNHSEFLGLSSLEMIDVSHNSLINFPVILLSLQKLNMIKISNNLIEKVPDGEWINSKVKCLDISFNKLSDVTKGLLVNSCVDLLNLKGNFITREKFVRFDGYDTFESRRKKRMDQGFEKNLDIKFDLCGLD
jgi:hypothetical protein